MSRRSRVPDAVASSGLVKSEPSDDYHVAPPSGGMHLDADVQEEDDPIVRTIDVFVSPALSNTLHLLQFPLQPAASSNMVGVNNAPLEARVRPRHQMLELEYPIPSSAQAGHRQLPDKMDLTQRTFTSTAIPPVTHMALAQMNKSGTRLDVVPLRRSVMQMRPSFRHLHDDDEEDPNAMAAEEKMDNRGRQRPVMFQPKESERSAAARKSSYAYQKASEESEQWIELDVHGSGEGSGSSLRKELMGRIPCKNREKKLRLTKIPNGEDGEGYVKSLNYLGRPPGDVFTENLSDWAPSTIDATIEQSADVDMADASSSAAAGATERATAELASKLAVLLQNGNGTMIPYRVLRSRFHPAKVPDDMLTAALSSVAVLVRGNFALKSTLAKFLNAAGGGETKKRRMRELRDVILLLLNLHGTAQRERLVRAYSARAKTTEGYDCITSDLITFVLKTVARQQDNCWVAMVDDDEAFAAKFPEVAARHAVYWMKKKEMLMGLIELYESAQPE